MTHALDRAPIDETRKRLRVNAGRNRLGCGEDASTSERAGNDWGGNHVRDCLHMR